MTDKIEALKAYALAHYDNGGEWVFETQDRADYQSVLDNVGGDINKAKQSLRKHWELISAVARDIENS